MALAASLDVQAELGRTLTADEAGRVAVLLDKASDMVLAITGPLATASTTSRVKARDGYARIPRDHVTAVTAVRSVLADGTTVVLTGWSWFKGPVIELLGAYGWVEIDYTFGYSPIPGEIVRLVAGLVARNLTAAPSALSGLSQETVGPYSASYRVDAGRLYLSGDERLILSRYGLPSVGRAYVG